MTGIDEGKQKWSGEQRGKKAMCQKNFKIMAPYSAWVYYCTARVYSKKNCCFKVWHMKCWWPGHLNFLKQQV